jgi:4-amino-4-deoxy-L-arabinose transferase-like glycosyltransferase
MTRSHRNDNAGMNTSLPRAALYQRALVIVFIVVLAFSVRALTANFIRAHLNDPGWFPFGIYALFDNQAEDWLDGRASIFWIDDATRTDKAIYAPGYPLWLEFIYKITASRTPQTVQNLQWVLDSFAVLLVVGIGVTAFDWRVGLCAGGIAALWPLLASYGAVPLADSPTSWIVVGATWMLLLSAKKNSLLWAGGAGLLLGASCWLRANALLLLFFLGVAVLVFMKAAWTRRVMVAAAVIAPALVIISPILIRNAIVFRAFVPTGLGVGTNLLEGIGETERGAKEFGVPATDRELLEEERAAANPPAGADFQLYYPDGIQRDRARTRRALNIIEHHPFWYAGSVLRRIAAVLKYAGQPNGIYGAAGINVTSKKSLPPQSQGAIISFLVNVLGMMQSVLRYLLLPLMLVGIYFGVRSDWRSSALILTTIFYYLVVGSLMHTHIRYGLPMQALLTIFAAVAAVKLVGLINQSVGLRRIKSEA